VYSFNKKHTSIHDHTGFISIQQGLYFTVPASSASYSVTNTYQPTSELNSNQSQNCCAPLTKTKFSINYILHIRNTSLYRFTYVRLNGLVVSTLEIRTRGFDSRVAPLFQRVATLDKLFTHIASPVSQLQETAVQKGSFRRVGVMVIKCARLS